MMNAILNPARKPEPQWPAEVSPLFVLPRALDAANEAVTSALRACAQRHLPRAGSILFRGFAPSQDEPALRRLAEAFGSAAPSHGPSPAAALLALTRRRRAWIGHFGPRTVRVSIQLADTREVYFSLARSTQRLLRQRGLRYGRLFRDGRSAGQAVFSASASESVEAFARASGYTASWPNRGELRLERVGAVLERHAQTKGLYFEDTTPMLSHAQGALTERELGFERREFELSHRDGEAVPAGVLRELVDAFSACCTPLELEAGDLFLFDAGLTCTVLPECAPELGIGVFEDA